MNTIRLIIFAFIFLFDLMTVSGSESEDQTNGITIDDFHVGFERKGKNHPHVIKSKSHKKHKKHGKKKSLKQFKKELEKVEEDMEDVSKKLFVKHHHHRRKHGKHGKHNQVKEHYFKDKSSVPFMMRAVIAPGKEPLPPLHFEFKENKRNCRCKCKI